MKITDTQPGKKDPTRVNIYLDGEFAFAVSQEIKILNHLKVGASVSDTQVQDLIFKDQTARLYDKALKFLSFRPRSRREIKTNLLQKLRLSDKGEEEKKTFEKSIESVLEKLEKIGQVNDLEFAKWWFDQRTRFKKISPRIIKSELFVKGIDKDVINQVIVEGEVDPFELALAAGSKKLASYKKLEPQEFKTKMSRYLGARGFDWEIIKKVVDTLWRKA